MARSNAALDGKLGIKNLRPISPREASKASVTSSANNPVLRELRQRELEHSLREEGIEQGAAYLKRKAEGDDRWKDENRDLFDPFRAQGLKQFLSQNAGPSLKDIDGNTIYVEGNRAYIMVNDWYNLKMIRVYVDLFVGESAEEDGHLPGPCTVENPTGKPLVIIVRPVPTLSAY